MSDTGFVVVRTFLNHIEADLARTALEAAGIEALVRQDDCGGVEPVLWVNGLSLVVPAADAEAAAEILATSSEAMEPE
jgi:hypothetical protein